MFEVKVLNNIFNGFDPMASSMGLGGGVIFGSFFVWFSSIFCFILMLVGYWQACSRLKYVVCFSLGLGVRFVDMSVLREVCGVIQVVGSLFMFMWFFNICGLVPFCFPLSSQFFYSLSLSLPIWLSLVFMNTTCSFPGWMGSFLPGGCFISLAVLVVLAEMLGGGARPVGLSVRLTANLTIGHLLIWVMGVNGSLVLFTSVFWFFIVFMFMVLFLWFESVVCIIQAYIFCFLFNVYFQDMFYGQET